MLAVPDNPQVSSVGFGREQDLRFPNAVAAQSDATAPYMHNGAFATLPDVVDFYRRISQAEDVEEAEAASGHESAGGRDQIDPKARQLNMRAGRQDLIAFLRALDDPGFDRTIPERVPSGLPVGYGRLQR